jgi:hypothetical protein
MESLIALSIIRYQLCLETEHTATAPQAADMEVKAATHPQTTPRVENKIIIVIMILTITANYIIVVTI